MRLELMETEDGSHTLRRPDLQETYHSGKGALGESQHVFIDTGLLQLDPRQKPIRIWGTGLNSLLTAQAVQAGQQGPVCMTALEPFPVPSALAAELNYPRFFPDPALAHQWLQQLHDGAWNRAISLFPGFQLRKIQIQLEDFQTEPEYFDLVYFDAFGPSRQAEVWCLDNLAKVKAALAPGGRLVTYAAQGQFKRNLKTLGFRVMCPPGFRGKREMTLAIRE